MFLSLRATRKPSSGSMVTLLMEGPSTWPQPLLMGAGHSSTCHDKPQTDTELSAKKYLLHNSHENKLLILEVLDSCAQHFMMLHSCILHLNHIWIKVPKILFLKNTFNWKKGSWVTDLSVLTVCKNFCYFPFETHIIKYFLQSISLMGQLQVSSHSPTHTLVVKCVNFSNW